VFLDEVVIHVRSGAGGSGSMTMRREKFVPKGGPDGGDGGRGGDVILVASRGLNSLSHFKGKRSFSAMDGGNGSRNLRHGADADPVRLLVPVGTVVHDALNGDLLGELTADAEEIEIARGGHGGRGNAHFAHSRNQAPRFAEMGKPGEEKQLRLELRLIADVGLVGAPNAGKSTLLSVLTAATPKVASYPFTTLEPNLGVADMEGERLVLADVPGLIEGASEGVGLGTGFLRHLSRTAVLVHVLDCAVPETEALVAFDQVQEELRRYDVELRGRVRVVALNKVDIPGAATTATALGATLEARGMVCHPVSAKRGEGVAELMQAIRVAHREQVLATPPKPVLRVYRPRPARAQVKVKKTGDVYVVSGRGVEMAVAQADLENPASLARLRRQLDAAGLTEALEKAGAVGGDTVMVSGLEFLFDPES
jgi:GTP-binding protein